MAICKTVTVCLRAEFPPRRLEGHVADDSGGAFVALRSIEHGGINARLTRMWGGYMNRQKINLISATVAIVFAAQALIVVLLATPPR